MPGLRGARRLEEVSALGAGNKIAIAGMVNDESAVSGKELRDRSHRTCVFLGPTIEVRVIHDEVAAS